MVIKTVHAISYQDKTERGCKVQFEAKILTSPQEVVGSTVDKAKRFFPGGTLQFSILCMLALYVFLKRSWFVVAARLTPGIRANF